MSRTTKRFLSVLLAAAMILSMGITGWGADYVLLDKNGNRCADVIYGMGQRSFDMGEEINKIMPEADLFSITGFQKIFFNTL